MENTSINYQIIWASINSFLSTLIKLETITIDTICLSWFFLKCVPLTQIQNVFVAKVWKSYIPIIVLGIA